MSEWISAPDDLRCPHCDYLIAGLPKNRCPECGREYDLRQLKADDAGHPQIAVPWDERKSILSYVRTWLLVAFRPRKFAMQFPLCHDSPRAFEYAVTSYALMALLVLSINLIDAREFSAVSAALMFAGVVACLSVICDTFLPLIFSFVVRDARHRNSLHFWRGISCYTSGFIPLSGGWWAITRSDQFWIDDDIAIVGLGLICLWWWIVLCMVVWRESRHYFQCLIAAILAPALAATLIGGAMLTAYILTPPYMYK